MTHYSHILKEDSKQLQPLLTPAGQAHLGTMAQEFVNNSYTSYNVLLTHPMDKIYTVTTQGGFLKADVNHTVDLLEGKCSCTCMQQMRLPCVHVFAVALYCYGLQWVSKIPRDEMKSIIGEEWFYKTWAALYQEPTIYGKMPTIEDLHAEMDSSTTSYPRTRRTKVPGSNGKGSFRFTSASEAGKKSKSFGNRRVNALCLICAKPITVPNSVAKRIAKGTYIKVHEQSACEKYASKNPSKKESIQAELEILRENLLKSPSSEQQSREKTNNEALDGITDGALDGIAVVGISDGTNVGGCILGSNVDISDGTAVIGISDGALDGITDGALDKALDGNEEATTGNGNESSDDDNTPFVYPLAPVAQQSKEEKKEAKKLKRYIEIYNKEGAYMADLFQNDRGRYRYERSSKQKTRKGTYLTDKQVEDQTKPYNTRRNNKK